MKNRYRVPSLITTNMGKKEEDFFFCRLLVSFLNIFVPDAEFEHLLSGFACWRCSNADFCVQIHSVSSV